MTVSTPSFANIARNTGAMFYFLLRAECTKLAEGKKVPLGEIARFFPGESLDTVPGSALPALKQFLLSRS